MEFEQIVKRLDWLDEEHRKDKAQIAECQNQIGAQYTQIAGLHKSLQDLEENVGRAQSTCKCGHRTMSDHLGSKRTMKKAELKCWRR